MPIDHVHALPPGTRFEEYRLDAVLGAGGFGITYRAYDSHLDTFVAIKEYLPAEFAARTEASTVVPKSNTDAKDYHWGLTRFLDEARTLARFNHPHLNRVLRFFEGSGTAYMVLEYIDGETLADRLSKEPYLEEATLQRLLKEVLSGLSVMHEAGYIHRDIKPGNLMLREEDGSTVVLDFGAARQAVGQRSRPITSILTPGYAPVEQYDGKVDRVGAWTDIYALGVVAYRCISGTSESQLPDAVARMLAQSRGEAVLVSAMEAGKGQYNPNLLGAIDWAIQVDEGDRPQSVSEWQAALAGGKVRKRTARNQHKPATKPAQTDTGRTGMRWSSVALTTVIMVVVGAVVWLAWQQYPEWFGQGAGDMPPAVQQVTPADAAQETPQEIDAGEASEMVASTEEPSQPSLATTSTEGTEQKVQQPATEPAKAAPAEEDEVTRLLAAAEADLKARRLASPIGNNAWEKYQDVLKLDRGNPEAVAGMEQVIESYMELLGAAVEQEDFDQASGYLERIRDLHPDSPALLTGKQRLAAARQARKERLAEQERQRRAEEEARLAEQERQRIEQAIKAHWEAFETAIEAEDPDEATGILTRIRGLNPDEPGLAAGGQRLEALRAELERKQQEAEEKMRQLAGEMVDIPGSTFSMGDLSGDGLDNQKPVHGVTVPVFRLGKYEVTFAQWDACVADGGCGGYRPDDEDWSRGNRPVINVSWDDIQRFIDWLNDNTGGNFRLPTEAEWEYAARAGSSTKYHFGNSESQLCRYGNHADTSTDYVWRNKTCSDGVGKHTAEVGRYEPNRFGLHDMHGNVWEWVEDCWNDSYVGAPANGSAWASGDCSQRVVRGGSWFGIPRNLRSATRYGDHRANRDSLLGFRLAQDK